MHGRGRSLAVSIKVGQPPLHACAITASRHEKIRPLLLLVCRIVLESGARRCHGTIRVPAYSKTPLAQKLGIKDSMRFMFIGEPTDFEKELPTLPATAIKVTPSAREVDLIVFFTPDFKTLRRGLSSLIKKLPAAGVLWIAWPKLASGVPTDLRENVVRDTLLATGLVDIKVCSINDTFSGLKFVRRLKDR